MTDFIVLDEYGTMYRFTKRGENDWNKYIFHNGEFDYHDNYGDKSTMEEFNDPKNTIFVRKPINEH